MDPIGTRKIFAGYLTLILQSLLQTYATSRPMRTQDGLEKDCLLKQNGKKLQAGIMMYKGKQNILGETTNHLIFMPISLNLGDGDHLQLGHILLGEAIMVVTR